DDPPVIITTLSFMFNNPEITTSFATRFSEFKSLIYNQKKNSSIFRNPLVLMLLLRLLSRLPFFFLYLLSDFLFVVVYYGVRYRRKLVRKNLKNAFPEKTKAERKRIEHQFYHNLCDYSIETLKLLTIREDEL